MLSYLLNLVLNWNNKTTVRTTDINAIIPTEYDGCAVAAAPAAEHKFDLRYETVDGATLRTKTQNHYYSFISKLAPAEEAVKKTYFMSLNELQNTHFEEKKHLLVRLVIEDHLKYFVEERGIHVEHRTKKKRTRVELIYLYEDIFKTIKKNDKFVPVN